MLPYFTRFIDGIFFISANQPCEVLWWVWFPVFKGNIEILLRVWHQEARDVTALINVYIDLLVLYSLFAEVSASLK